MWEWNAAKERTVSDCVSMRFWAGEVVCAFRIGY